MVVVFDTDEVFGRGICGLLSGAHRIGLGRSNDDAATAQVVIGVVREVRSSRYEPWLRSRTGKLVLVFADGALARFFVLVRALKPEAVVHCSAASSTLHDCVRGVLEGREFVDPSVALALFRWARAPLAADRLSIREREIAEMLLLGWSNKQISASTGLSISTVKCHVGNVLKKTGSSSRAEAILALAGIDLVPENEQLSANG